MKRRRWRRQTNKRKNEKAIVRCSRNKQNIIKMCRYRESHNRYISSGCNYICQNIKFPWAKQLSRRFDSHLFSFANIQMFELITMDSWIRDLTTEAAASRRRRRSKKQQTIFNFWLVVEKFETNFQEANEMVKGWKMCFLFSSYSRQIMFEWVNFCTHSFG